VTFVTSLRPLWLFFFKEAIMQISVILAHPNRKSFNHAIANAVVKSLESNGHIVFFHDLYSEKFDPVLTYKEIPDNASLPGIIGKHCDEIAKADGIVIVHPNWWGQPPAILKGWIDRIIRPKIAYEFLEGDSGEGVPNGMLKAGTAIVFNTSNTTDEREKNVFGDPLETIWKNCIFGLCGITSFHRRMFNIIITSTEDQRKKWLEEAREDIDKFFPE
jgi:NAD(P)H dehydrogenase (quinone)